MTFPPENGLLHVLRTRGFSAVIRAAWESIHPQVKVGGAVTGVVMLVLLILEPEFLWALVKYTFGIAVVLVTLFLRERFKD